MDSSSSQLNQNFSVIYNNLTLKVDPILVSRSSYKFQELIRPYVQSDQLSNVHLEIQIQGFSERCINNFLRLCQNLQTDVQNSEMKEMCEIARMFKANQIYNTGLSFIQSNIDPNFNVPENKYETNQYLVIKENKSVQIHDFDDFEFDDGNDPNATKLKKCVSLTGIVFDESVETEKKSEEPKPEVVEVDGSLLEAPSKSKSKKKHGAKFSSIIYIIKCENRPLKPTIYQFSSNGHIIYTAKQKENIICISEGKEVHIKNEDSHICRIKQFDDFYNIIMLKGQQIRLNYVKTKANLYSIDVTFMNQDQKVAWSPKPPKYDIMSPKYNLNYQGEYKRSAIRSKNNIVLQNLQGKKTFIVRKMDLYTFEVECLPAVNPIVAFAIALSDIVGPYMDPFGDIDIAPNK